MTRNLIVPNAVEEMSSLKELARNCAPGVFGGQNYDSTQNVNTLRAQINTWLTSYNAEIGVGGSNEAKSHPPLHVDPAGFELSSTQLTHILKRCSGNIEDCVREWQKWMLWRQDLGVDVMTEADFEPMARLGIADWRGCDKEGRPCLVLTARFLPEDEAALPTGKLFQQYIIWIAEQGVRLCREQHSDTACLLYDRRAMEFKHLNTRLHTACKPIFKLVSRFYDGYIGRLYILHMNVVFRLLFSWALKPMLWLVSDPSKIHRCETRADLREFFDTSGLLLASAGLEEGGWSLEEEEEEGGAQEGQGQELEGVRQVELQEKTTDAAR